MMLNDLLDLAAKRKAVFYRAATFGVSARISWKEDKRVGVLQFTHGLLQMRESFLKSVCVERAESSGVTSLGRSLPLFHAGEQQDAYPEALLVREVDCTRHLLIVSRQEIRSRAKSAVAEFQIVVTTGSEKFVYLRIARRQIGRRCHIQPHRLETLLYGPHHPRPPPPNRPIP